MSSNYFVGIDLHTSVIQICVLDQDGEITEQRRWRGESLEDGLEVVDELARIPQARYAVEAVGMNRWLVNAMRAKGLDVIVVDAGRLNLHALGKKTDKRDAQEIARRLRMGDLDRHYKTYFPTDEEYGVRKLIRTRHKLVSLRQQVVNQLRGLFRAYRVPAPKGSLYGKKNLELLKRLTFLDENLGFCLAKLVVQLESIHASVREFSKQIEAVSKREPRVSVAVQTLPGVGAQTATTLIYELGDVSRFRSARAVACFAGLAPRVTNSADKSHHGQITKRGNPELRWILNQWAVRLLTRNSAVREWAAPKYRRMHKNKVRTALARKLLVGVYVMLSRGEAFSLERCLGLSARAG